MAEAIEEMIVVSLIGEQWSPKIPPANAAATNGASGSPRVSAAGTAIGLKKLDYDRIAQAGILAAAFFVASLIHVPIGPSNAHLILNGLVGLLLACASVRVQKLNKLGAQAEDKHDYDKAVDYYTASLAIDPGQEEVRTRLHAAQVFLRQGYVYEIYKLFCR